MPAFPFPKERFGAESRSRIEDGLQLFRSQSGVTSGFTLWPAAKREFSLVFPALTTTDRDSIFAQYASTKISGGVTLQWIDGATYTCRYVEPPQDVPMMTMRGRRWRVTCTLREE